MKHKYGGISHVSRKKSRHKKLIKNPIPQFATSKSNSNVVNQETVCLLMPIVGRLHFWCTSVLHELFTPEYSLEYRLVACGAKI